MRKHIKVCKFQHVVCSPPARCDREISHLHDNVKPQIAVVECKYIQSLLFQYAGVLSVQTPQPLTLQTQGPFLNHQEIAHLHTR